MRSARSFVRALAIAGAIVVFAWIPAFAQTPSPAATAPATAPATASATPSADASGSASPSAGAKIAPPGPPASYYASYGLMGIAGLTLIAVLAGFLFQAPGFRRSSKSTATPSE